MSAPLIDIAPSAASDPAASAASTVRPRDPHRGRKALGWVVIVLLVLGVAAVGLRVAAQIPSAHPALDPEGRGDNGTMALAELLRQRGVDVDVVRSRSEAFAALRDDSTLVTPDAPALTDGALAELADAANHTVILTAGSRMLRLLDLGEPIFGPPDTAATDCDWAPFAHVGSIAPDRMVRPAPGITGCFTDGEAGAAVLVDTRGGGVITLVHAQGVLTNAALADDGHAALGLALMGQTGHVVWYVPSFTDTDLEYTDPDTLGTLTPEWVTPVILLLLLAGLATTLAKGRRFGPLVAETLPVTVRASETMNGRARLTAKAADAAHAAAALRTGALRRLARRMGLSEQATASDVTDSAADRLRIPRTSLHALLQGDLPDNDPDLIHFARQLDELERAVDATAYIERNTP